MTHDEIIAQLNDQRKVLVGLLGNKNPVSPSIISEVALKLSVLNEMLGDHMAKLKLDQLYAEKEAYEKSLSAEKSVSRAKEKSRLDSAKERYEYERVYTKHQDIWKLISVAQTHINAERDEQKGIK